MTSHKFYLLGDEISSAKAIQIDSKLDLEGLQHLISSHFAIVKPDGKCHNLQTWIL